MAKKNKSFTEEAMDYTGGMIGGGAGLSVGAGAIGKLPASAAKTGVLSGLETAGKFMPVMGTIGAAGLTMKQVRKLQQVDKEKKDNRGYRI